MVPLTQCLDVRRRRPRGSVDVVPALKQGHEPSTTVLIGDLHGRASHAAEDVVGEVEAPEQVVHAAVETRREDHQVGREAADGWQEGGIPVAEHVRVPRSAVEVHVDVESGAVALATQRRVAGAWVRVPVVRREEEHARITVERVLGRVPVVVVPVDDEYTLEAMNPLGITGRDGSVAVEAEALLLTGVVRVVAGRAAGAEGVLHLSTGNRVHHPQGTRNRELRDLTGHRDPADRLDVVARVMRANERQGVGE